MDREQKVSAQLAFIEVVVIYHDLTQLSSLPSPSTLYLP